MKRKSKLLAVLLCGVILASVVLGGSVSVSAEEETRETATVEQQLLFEGNDIKVTAKGMQEGDLGPELKLLIENNSGESIVVQTINASINGFMVSTMMSGEVAAGKKANDSLIFDTYSLENCGIEAIATMEFSFIVLDSKSWDTIFQTESITVNTSIASTYVQEVDDSGELLVDENDVKIVEKGLLLGDDYEDPRLLLYVENNSIQDISIYAADVSINGFMIDAGMTGETIVAGKKAVISVLFYSWNLEENDITDIEDIELYFSIVDSESWDTIFDSDIIALSF